MLELRRKEGRASEADGLEAQEEVSVSATDRMKVMSWRGGFRAQSHRELKRDEEPTGRQNTGPLIQSTLYDCW